MREANADRELSVRARLRTKDQGASVVERAARRSRSGTRRAGADRQLKPTNSSSIANFDEPARCTYNESSTTESLAVQSTQGL